MSTSSLPPVTYEDWLATPEGELVELVEGELVDMTFPTVDHQYTVGELFVVFRAYAREHGGRAYGSATGVRLAEATVLGPDVTYLAPSFAGELDRVVNGAPTIVVEVSSPSTRSYDQVRKRRLYARYGVDEFWFVDLQRERIEVSVREGDTYGVPAVHLRGDVAAAVAAPGLEVVVDEVLGAPPDDA